MNEPMVACRFHLIASLFLIPLTLPVLHADVTLRYKMGFTMNPALSAQTAGAMKGMDSVLSQGSVVRLKGGKGFYTSMASDSIVDFTTQETTLLDPAGKRFAKLKSDQFAEETARAMPEMPAMPAAAGAAMASMKTEVSPAKLTGRTAVIQGVETEEREIVISIDGPTLPNMPPGPMIRMVMQLWSATPGEILRVPAIRELTGYSRWSYATMNPMDGIEKMMKHMPGVSGVVEPLMKEMQKGIMLRMHMDMFMPAMAALLKQMPAGNPFGASFDPPAPFMQMSLEAAELSSDPVPDSVFEIPEGYRAAPASDLVQAMFAKSRAAVKQ
jgi:hypothetical protein